jgi:hypothetical protein
MTKISEYPIISNPTEDDILIGTDVNSSDVTKNFSIGSIIDLIGDINQGPIGPQGNTGPTGPQGPVGPAGLNWQGEWVSGSNYSVDDAVGYGGASYFCISNSSGIETPNEDPTHWALLASQGAVGPTGPAGPIGPQGPVGGSEIFKNIKVTLSSAQILSLYTTPVELVPAVTGKLLVPQFLFQKYNHVSTAYTTSGLFRVGLGSINLGIATFAAVITSADNAQGLNNLSYNQSASGLTYQNLPIVVGATTANPTGGNGTLDLYLTYLEVTL